MLLLRADILKQTKEVVNLKKILAYTLALLLIATAFAFAPMIPPEIDAVSAATPWVEETPAAPATPAAPSSSTVSAPAGSAFHIVVSGDTMFKIAAKYGMTLNQLLTLNPQVTNRDLIFVGQKIAIKAGTSGTTGSSSGSMSTQIYEGMGYTVAFRNGPGADDEGVPVYSFNIAMARATFDAQGRILDVFIDGYEVATPNYDGASMPHFSGWPDTEGYNVTNHDTGKVTGLSVNTKESAAAEVNAWLTKRQRGDSYHMNPTNEWWKQMDFFQQFFKGKTVAELEAWFAKNTTAAGRPIKITTTNADDLAKLAKLTEAEKAQLAEVVAGATMSVRDSHGDFLGAVGEAYKNRKPVTITVK